MGIDTRWTFLKHRKNSIVSAFASLMLAAPSSVFGGSVAGTGGATELTQIANNAQLMQQTDQMVVQSAKLQDQIQKQFEMLEDMKRNGRQIDKNVWGSTAKDLKKLAEISRQGEALAYSSANMDALFREKYRGFDHYKKESTGDSTAMSARYQEWTDSNREAIKGALKGANLQYQQFESEEETMRSIQKLGSSSKGRMQAIQVGNMIASQQVSQIQKLRSLMMDQMQLQSSYLTFEANQRDAAKAQSLEFFRNDLSKININDGESF